MDLDAYLERIDYRGERAPTLAALRGIVLGHATSIPFENLTPLAGRPVELELDALERKLVHGGRGGYCFEQNGLLGHALTALGFSWTGLAARVVWNQPEDALTPEAHMLLRVVIDGEDWLVDVGFGGATPTAPLRLAADIEQATPHEPFRLLADGHGFRQQIRLGGDWSTVYRFHLRERFEPDYRVANWYTSTHPASLFRNTLMAALPRQEGRVALRDRELNEYAADGSRVRRELVSVEELRDALTEKLGVRLPNDAALEEAFERLFAPRGAASAGKSPA